MGASYASPAAFHRPVDPAILASCEQLPEAAPELAGWGVKDVEAVWRRCKQRGLRNGAVAWPEYIALFEGHEQVRVLFLITASWECFRSRRSCMRGVAAFYCFSARFRFSKSARLVLWPGAPRGEGRHVPA